MTQFKDKAAKLGFKDFRKHRGDDLKNLNIKVHGLKPLSTQDCSAIPCLWLRTFYCIMRTLCQSVKTSVNTWNSVAILPNVLITNTRKPLSSQNPTFQNKGQNHVIGRPFSAKMSKSDDNERATLYILDEPDRIRKKIGSAVTDSGSEIKATSEKSGVTNLLTIHSALSGRNQFLTWKNIFPAKATANSNPNLPKSLLNPSPYAPGIRN